MTWRKHKRNTPKPHGYSSWFDYYGWGRSMPKHWRALCNESLRYINKHASFEEKQKALNQAFKHSNFYERA